MLTTVKNMRENDTHIAITPKVCHIWCKLIFTSAKKAAAVSSVSPSIVNAGWATLKESGLGLWH